MEAIVQAIPTAIELAKTGVKVGRELGAHISKAKAQKEAKKLVKVQAFANKLAKNPPIPKQRITKGQSPLKSLKLTSGSTGKYSRTMLHDGSMVIEGSDYLSSVVSTTGVVGEVLLTQIISPLELGNTRLQNECRNFESFFFEKFEMSFQPIKNAFTDGALCAYFDMDVLEVPDSAGGEANLRRADAHAKNVNFQVWERASLSMPPPRDAQVNKYFCDNQGDDSRLSQQGLLVIINAATTGSGQSLGFVEIKYRIRFMNPQLALSPVSGQASQIVGVTGMTPLNILGTAPLYNPYNSFKVTWDAVAGFLTLQKGTYWITTVTAGTFTGALTPAVQAPNTVTTLASINSGTNQTSVVRVNIVGVSGGVTFTCTGSSVTTSAMYITLLPIGMTREGNPYKKLNNNTLIIALQRLVDDIVPERNIDVLDYLTDQSKGQVDKKGSVVTSPPVIPDYSGRSSQSSNGYGTSARRLL